MSSDISIEQFEAFACVEVLDCAGLLSLWKNRIDFEELKRIVFTCGLQPRMKELAKDIKWCVDNTPIEKLILIGDPVSEYQHR